VFYEACLPYPIFWFARIIRKIQCQWGSENAIL
jgi:hypothetical protein